MLDWWMANKIRFGAWREAKRELQVYYGDRYRADHAHHELLQLRQTGTVQDHLAEVDRLNAYAEIPQHQLIRILLPQLKTAYNEIWPTTNTFEETLWPGARSWLRPVEKPPLTITDPMIKSGQPPNEQRVGEFWEFWKFET